MGTAALPSSSWKCCVLPTQKTGLQFYSLFWELFSSCTIFYEGRRGCFSQAGINPQAGINLLESRLLQSYRWACSLCGMVTLSSLPAKQQLLLSTNTELWKPASLLCLASLLCKPNLVMSEGNATACTMTLSSFYLAKAWFPRTQASILFVMCMLVCFFKDHNLLLVLTEKHIFSSGDGNIEHS